MGLIYWSYFVGVACSKFDLHSQVLVIDTYILYWLVIIDCK